MATHSHFLFNLIFYFIYLIFLWILLVLSGFHPIGQFVSGRWNTLRVSHAHFINVSHEAENL